MLPRMTQLRMLRPQCANAFTRAQHTESAARVYMGVSFTPCTGVCTGVCVIVAGVVVALLIFLALMVGVALGVVLGRRAQDRKGGAPQRKEMSQERKRAIGTTPVGRTTEEEKEDTNDHTYDFVYVENLAEKREMLYHGMEEEAQDYVSMYNQLGRGIPPRAGPQGQRGEAPVPHGQQEEEGTWKK